MFEVVAYKSKQCLRQRRTTGVAPLKIPLFYLPNLRLVSRNKSMKAWAVKSWERSSRLYLKKVDPLEGSTTPFSYLRNRNHILVVLMSKKPIFLAFIHGDALQKAPWFAWTTWVGVPMSIGSLLSTARLCPWKVRPFIAKRWWPKRKPKWKQHILNVTDS